MWRRTVLVFGLVVLAGCAPAERVQPPEGLVIAPDVVERRARFATETVSADLSHLPKSEREAARRLVAAARTVHEIFALQVWAGNAEMQPQVEQLAGPLAAAAREYYRIMVGPWDRIDHFRPFLGDRPHPAGAGFYPEDLTVTELEAWLEANPGDREAFTALHTVIRREGERLRAVPFSEAYTRQLELVAAELRAAAAATGNLSLRRFLELRADDLFLDDYYESDLAWMDLDSALEVVIGPYETYEDQLLGAKAAFEAFICVAQPEDSERLAVFKSQLPFLEQSLPIPDEHKNLARGAESPIRVVDVLYTAGDARAGVQTIAFNLPNDERVREAKGSKKVLLKNVMRAKFDSIQMPIAALVLPAEAVDRVDFEAFYLFTLHHELAHGLGPGRITIDGRETEVRLELKDLYSAFEEAKADVLGVLDIYTLVKAGVMEPAILDTLPWTYTAGIFRTTRFGVAEAHGLGMVLQANFLLERGAVLITEEGRFVPVPELFEQAFRDLAHELLMIQARGDLAAAAAMVERYGAVRPEMAAAIAGLEGLPVDIDPSYPLEGLQ